MAAQLSANPWTVAAADAGTVNITGKVKIRHIEFVGYNAITDVCEVTNTNGLVIWDGHGAADFEVVRSGPIGWVTGVKVPTISSGYVRIYVD